MLKQTLTNISERLFLAACFKLFKPLQNICTIEWAMQSRSITQEETSFGVGKFDPDFTPYMEYVYDCLDNPHIPTIVAMKSARIAWTETLNNYRGNRIQNRPTTMLLGFGTKEAARTFAKVKWKLFLQNTPVLNKLVDADLAENKKSLFDYSFPGGSLRFRTLGSIASAKSDNLPYIEVEEPDDIPDNVSNQGNTFSNLQERQKLVPITMKKFIFGGTPTNMDFSTVETAVKASNQLVFKAECHSCGGLVPMDGTSFDCINYSEYPNRKIDEVYGKYDPSTAKFHCPMCKVAWTFEQKNLNIRAGKKHGFVDHTGKFSKGWHPKKPEITNVFGFLFSELLSPFAGSNFVELADKRIKAEMELAKGREGLMKTFYNNSRGMPYASGISALCVEDMRKLRSNYPEGIVPMDGLVLTMGVDVQANRFAFVIRAWGRNKNSWLVTWKEIFGNTQNYADPVWTELRNIITAEYPHSSGKTLRISGCSIDSGWNTELVYQFVKEINQIQGYESVLATKGSDELRFSHDEIYNEPAEFDILTEKQARRTLAETMGVKVYNIGAHKAHNEILRRVGLNQIEGCYQDRYFFNEQSYGQYEEQMTSCRKLIDERSGVQREVYKLVSGKRKEAIDAEKNALMNAYALGIPLYTNEHWTQIEKYLYN